MTSRRPMTRSYSGNGRTSSFSEDEGSSSNGRSESRNIYLSNVRPENRSTLCTVMAQLTEDIQPSFETTLKSKAVSENCNVKFTCVVSGYPAPELKWYKDDMEMDRYCGLPKYEIHRNGKTHTLHIYNCTLDDAAIYQVSASNSKGIVSCSGVLEVGTMNEFQIHQRFFAKLKQKAERKKRDLEAQNQIKKEDKENIEEEQRQISPERPPRKRHVPPPEKTPDVKEPKAVEEMGAAAEPNGFTAEVKETAPVTTKDSERDEEISPSEETSALKKIKISNGVDDEVNCSSSSYSSTGHMMGNGVENSYDGGISLAQFLAETLQSRVAEEKQNSSRGEKPKEMDIPVVNASIEKDREQERTWKEKEEQEKALQEAHEREKRREKELAVKKERERERPLAASHTVPHTKHGSEVKHHSKAHKDHDHHNIQASISSMLHTVKDFLFGKSKKDTHDHIESKERALDWAPAQPPQSEVPPSLQLHLEQNRESKPLTDNVAPMEMDTVKEPSETVHVEKQSEQRQHENNVQGVDLPAVHVEKQSEQRQHENTVQDVDLPAVHVEKQSEQRQHENNVQGVDLPAVHVEKQSEQRQHENSVQDVDLPAVHVEKQSEQRQHENTVQDVDLPAADEFPPERTEKSTGQSGLDGQDDDAVEAMEVSVGPERSSPGERISLSGPQVVSEVVSVIEAASTQPLSPDFLVVSPQPSNQAARDESSPRDNASVSPQTQAPCEEESSPTPGAISTSDDHGLGEEPTELLREEERRYGETGKEPDAEEGHSSNKREEEKAEVKSDKQPHSDTSRLETTELAAWSTEDRMQPCDSTTPSQVLSPLSTVAANSAERGNTTEGTAYASPAQGVNVGFPPIVTTEGLENSDLIMQQECTSSVAEESTEVHSLSPIQSPNSGLKDSEGRGEPTEVLSFALATDSEDESRNKQETQEPAFPEGERTEARDENVQFEVEEEKKDLKTGEEFDESKNLSVTQNMEGHADVLEDHSNVAPQGSREILKGWPSDNIPQIQICTIEDTPDVKPVLPDVSPNEHFMIPKIDIMEPELKESSLPLTTLPLNAQKKESAVLQKNDATHLSAVIIQDESMADSPHSLPTHKASKRDYSDHSRLPTEKVKDVDKTEMLERPPVKSSELLPRMDLALIPVINVSFADDKDNDVNVNTRMSDVPQPFESPTAPLFVVPPISVTCHESDSELRLSTQSESTGSETSSAVERGTKYGVDNNTVKPEKTQSRKQKLEEMTENILKDGIPSILFDVPMPTVGDNGPSFSKTTQDNIFPEILKTKPINEAKIEKSLSVEDLQRNKSSVDRLYTKPPTHPSLSPASLRKFMSKASPDPDNESVTTVPLITVGDRQNDKADEDLSGGSTPTSSLSRESSPRLKRRDSLTLIRSATPEELASGARRKIFIPKPKDEGDGSAVGGPDAQGKKETPYMSPSQARRAALLQAPSGQNTPPMERRSPLLSRRKVTLEVPKVVEEIPKEEPVSTKQEEKPAEKKLDPLKAPQVIRKIRGEPFPDASGHLKLWCQFFNVLSDSTIKWYRDEEEILEVKRSGGDESQVALAIVLASSQDCGVYGCSISNEHGTDTTDYLLSIDVLTEILLRDDLEVGEEIEMTPMLFTKGLADCGSWGEKYFGRIMTETAQIGQGCAHKASRVRVIYGLDPIFESGSACVMKVQNPIAYGTKKESNLVERNGEITKLECKVQNMIREYCKIFAAEARVVENFGFSLEVIPQYLMYRPANSVPYATVEADLKGDLLKYCMMDPKGKLITQSVSEVEQKCGTFQHWIHQWTHGNLLVTRLEGVETKITNVRVATKSKGYQGLTECGSPELFEQFLTQHICNYFCGLLGLRPLKTMDSLQPTKTKASRSPLLNRKLGSSSPQTQRKGQSPQMLRKANSSPKVTRKALETEDNKSSPEPKPADVLEISYQSHQ